jgi:DNA topoisomerase-1
MPKNLVIVESPAKAKTIENYLGADFKVTSSFGHVRDLPKGDHAIDIKNDFEPTYEISSDKIDLVKSLKKLSKEAEVIWLATDDDREGEAISWHLKEALSLKDQDIKRIVFREITKQAILNAIEKPRTINTDLVNAQQARRVLDRLVGFELSPILWKKIKTGLSAGRVQSVAVRLVVEREREIEAFKTKSEFKVTAQFETLRGKAFKAELHNRFAQQVQAREFLEKCIGAGYSVRDLEVKPVKKSPAPPFTTSTLQQEASRKLSFSVAQTMNIAQKLYESGRITYMRTDSLNLSEQAIAQAKSTIESQFGATFSQSRKFKTKSESAQEAHEAIRPTDFNTQKISGDRNEQRLYELIWKRAIASQMSDAQLEKTIAHIQVSTVPQEFQASGEVIKFEGFLKVYLESSDEEEEEEGESILPLMNKGEALGFKQMLATERFSKPAARYTEASLVKKLEEMGIGRPSTYAPTISTIIKREYVIKESRDGKERMLQELVLSAGKISQRSKKEVFGSEKAKLFPTDIAMVVNDFLVKHFATVVDFSFTANVEKEFDDIASGRKPWKEMIRGFYSKFHPTVEQTEGLDRASVGASRELGLDPVSGKPVIVRLGRFGPLVQIGQNEDTEKPRFASLKKGQLMENVSLEEALELFKLPREVGNLEGKPMTVGIGKFGPYVRHDGKFYSLSKEDDPYTVTEERSIALIRDKSESDAKKIIKLFDGAEEVKVLNGRFGPYIVVGKKNVKIPKGKEPEALTLEECLALAEASPEKKPRFAGKKKK